MTEPMDLLWGNEIRAELASRRSPYYREKIPTAKQGEYEDRGEGWVLDKSLKHTVWMRKKKTHDAAFRDDVWAMCARLGFSGLNRGSNISLACGSAEYERKIIDVMAVDDEVSLLVDCRSSNTEQSKAETFKEEIEEIQRTRAGLVGTVRKQLPGLKVKYVLAVNNIHVSEQTMKRIEGADIAFIDDEAVRYYHQLADHLGSAAKFQLLGNLFHGQKIAAMDATVPAIRGKMGGYTYYSFAIEPERLLKIAYVLHRNNANMRWMPTYQRIIKRSRLKRVAEYVDRGGFFPNSLIINVDNGGRALRFDKSEKQTGSTTLGVLHLPTKYRSAYVIDGQHRLFGYAHSNRASTELVPVVAFVDMPGTRQLAMFMDINENQQSVPKNLRLTLKADLEWESHDLRLQAQALKLKVAQQLGEQKSSPLHGRVILGEEKANDRLCISLDAVSRGIERARFIGEFTTNEMRKPGSFYRGSIDSTLEPLTKFLEYCLGFLRDSLPTQWNIGRGEGGFVFTNAGAEAILRVLGDLVDYLVGEGRMDPRQQKPRDVFVQVRPLLGHLVTYLDGLSSDEAAVYRTWLGSGAPTKYLRQFQCALAEVIDGFSPEGLEEWRTNQEKQFNAESYTMVHEIEGFLHDDVRRKLEDGLGAEWFKLGVPQPIFSDANTRAAAKQYEVGLSLVVDWWDCLYLVDYQKIFLHGGQERWLALFDDTYTLPSDGKSSWKARFSWLNELNRIRNKVSHNSEAVTEDEYGFLQTIHSHLGLGSAARVN